MLQGIGLAEKIGLIGVLAALRLGGEEPIAQGSRRGGGREGGGDAITKLGDRQALIG